MSYTEHHLYILDLSRHIMIKYPAIKSYLKLSTAAVNKPSEIIILPHPGYMTIWYDQYAIEIHMTTNLLNIKRINHWKMTQEPDYAKKYQQIGKEVSYIWQNNSEYSQFSCSDNVDILLRVVEVLEFVLHHPEFELEK